MLDSVSILLIARWINDPINPKLDNDETVHPEVLFSDTGDNDRFSVNN